jgi:hypothetical protein
MRRFLFYVVVIPFTVLLVALSVANRGPVTLSLDPLGLLGTGWSLTMPLFVLLFLTMAVGVLVGGVAAWSGQRKWRFAARGERANVARLRREVERLRVLADQQALPPRYDRDAA